VSDSTSKPFWRRAAFGWALMWVVIIVTVVVSTRVYTPGEEPELVGRGGNSDIIDDPAAYAQEEYSTVIKPAIEDNAVELTELLDAIQADVDAAGEEYGGRNGQSAWSFPVTATGTIAEGSFGEVTLEVAGLTEPSVGIQTGPAITGTALRDATGTITFSMFTNQTDFASVATEINNQMKDDLLANMDLTEMIGQEVTVTGAFTYDDSGHILITPTSIEVQ